MAGSSARYRTSAADGGPDPPRPVSPAPEHRRLIARLEGVPADASGADKSRGRRGHADAVRHFASARRGVDPLAPLASALKEPAPQQNFPETFLNL